MKLAAKCQQEAQQAPMGQAADGRKNESRMIRMLLSLKDEGLSSIVNCLGKLSGVSADFSAIQQCVGYGLPCTAWHLLRNLAQHLLWSYNYEKGAGDTYSGPMIMKSQHGLGEVAQNACNLVPLDIGKRLGHVGLQLGLPRFGQQEQTKATQFASCSLTYGTGGRKKESSRALLFHSETSPPHPPIPKYLGAPKQTKVLHTDVVLRALGMKAQSDSDKLAKSVSAHAHSQARAYGSAQREVSWISCCGYRKYLQGVLWGYWGASA
eukprot:1267783-Amphidinium_carterae.2